MNGSMKSLRTSEKTLEAPASSQTSTYCASLDVVEHTALPKYEGEADQKNYLTGWNLHALTAALCLSLFLANFEISIVSTSLVAITDELKGFGRSSWIVTSYLLTYTGLLIIWAKLSDIFGRKSLLIISILIFIVFSGACGASQTMTQLIALRAFQGIGGSGIYSLCMVIFFEMVPSSKHPAYTALVAALFTVSLLLGPLMGGLINVHTTWRWVFLLNVPTGFVAIVLLLFTLPSGFPNQGQVQPESWSRAFTSKPLRRVDLLGACLMLTASTLLVAALQQTVDGMAWSSASVIALIVLSSLLWPVFLIWEWLITTKNFTQEPVLPWRFVANRIVLGLILNTFFVGVLFTVCVIQIPLRFQTANGASPLWAGIHLLPFALACPTGSIIVAALTKRKLPPIFLLLVGAALQIVGIALMSTVPTGEAVWTGQYGYEVITGLGVGINIGSASIVAPFCIDSPSDLSVITAAVVQFRVVGGAVGLAIVTCVMNSWLKSQLSRELLPAQLDAIFESTTVIGTFSPGSRDAVKRVFAQGFNLQMRIIVGFAAACEPKPSKQSTRSFSVLG